MSRRSSMLTFFTFILFGLTSSALHAQDTQIHACVKSNGKIRIVSATDTCKARETPLVWNIQGPPGPVGQMNGIRDFTSDGTFTVPDGITRLLIEAWGGGGGGGGGAVNVPDSDPGGGGGGGGGYVRGLVDVVSGQTYNVFIGIAGAGGGAFIAGAPGGTTSFEATDGTVLIAGGGGSGGGPGTANGPGAGGGGGAGNANGGILSAGKNGNNGTGPPLSGDGGPGGASVIGARFLPASAGGRGGDGGGQPGTDGGPGYMSIQW